MKITFLGNFGVDFSSESHYLKTFRKMGHEVIPMQEGKVKAMEVLANAKTSDMFFWVHTHTWHTPGMELVLKELKRLNIPSVGYHLDLWMGIERQRDLESDPYWGIEHFFTVDQQMVPVLEAKGIKAHFLHAGVFEDECYLGDVKPEFQHDVIFVGSKNYHHEWKYRPELINWLESTYGNRFARYSGDSVNGVVRGKRLNDLYASAKVVVGDTLCPNFDYPYYFSDRIFETTGRGGFIIHPYIKGIEDIFELGSEILTYDFGKFDQLKDLIDTSIEMNEAREEIRLAGHNRTKKHHTYTNRLQHIIDTINAI